MCKNTTSARDGTNFFFLERVFKTSLFARLALYFLINSKLAFSLRVSQRRLPGTAKKKRLIYSGEQCKKELFAFMFGNIACLA